MDKTASVRINTMKLGSTPAEIPDKSSKDDHLLVKIGMVRRQSHVVVFRWMLPGLLRHSPRCVVMQAWLVILVWARRR